MTKPRIVMVTTNGVNNYGAALQAYALHRKLSEFGDVSTLNYSNRHICSSMDIVRLKPSFHGLLGAAKDLCRIVPRTSAIRKFRAFEQKHLNLTAKLDCEGLSAGLLDTFDVYVSGSDQIWNPNCVSPSGTFDRTYFLDFAPRGSRKVSFASSIGGFQPTHMELQELARLLEDFEKISVREIDTQLLLGGQVKKTVHHSLDPTLMLNAREWLTLSNSEVLSRTPEKYLLLYSVPKIPLVFNAVKVLAKKLNLPIVALDQDPFLKIKTNTHIRGAGPEDFIALFRNAAFVVTDSFHGTCFSINFEIPFCVPTAGVHSNRIASILNLTNLSARLITRESQINEISPIIDFSDARTALQVARARDQVYLSSFFDKGILK